MCRLVIDTGALTRNLEKLRHYTSARIIAVVKGGGYGLGLAPYAQWLTAQGVDMLAVSSAAEAAALRDAGITADVLMLSSTALPEEVSALLARNVILTVGSFDAAHTVSAVAAQQGVTARVHIKLDTGMGRCGFLPGDVREAAALLRFLPALRVEGVFTHFADAANRRRTARQYRRFTAGVRILRTAGIDPGLRHVCASTAFLRYPEMHLDAVRLGSALLPVGYTSGIGVTEEPNALRLRDRLRRVLHAGRSLLHTDGLTVQINGRSCPVRGVVAAAQLEADVTELPCAVGDTVRVEVRPKFVDSGILREYR